MILMACVALPAHSKTKNPKIVFLIAEKEYRTDETLHGFFNEELAHLEIEAKFVTAPPDGPDRNNLKGLAQALQDADLLFLSVRRRAPTTAQMKALRAYVEAGKPIIGIRTSSHPFHLRGKTAPQGHALWEAFDPDILGGNYTGHHGNQQKTWFRTEPTAKGHPILKGLPSAETEKIPSGGSLYKVLPLADKAEVLLHGFAEGVEQSQPVAWTHKPESGNRVFYTSLGHLQDFQQPAFRILLLNAVHWTLGLPSPGHSRKPPPNPQKQSRLPKLNTPGDLELELVLREPQVGNPLYLNFDERGRLWVVEYLQYPWPAGLRLVSHDKVYRNVYDPPHAPPPPHPPGSPFRGKDRISIHEDTDGDGTFDSRKIFLDGLSIATAALKGRGGVYVLNPPYLLFYADADNDDRPDSPTPRVLLSGFGLEDSHSIANSLRWGPDGWLYATHGSTVTAYVRRHGPDNQPLPGEKPIHRMGQFAWRYHPETHRFEIFAEGGGNAFGVEFDSAGRLFSGHNGGDTRGFHYVQGGYYRKTFGKHGNLSNPYAFAHFPAMAHSKVQRFTHTFEIYEDTALPARYHGKLFGVSPNLRHLVASHIRPHGSTLRTEDIDHPVTIGDDPRDKWFAPVDIQAGPDGHLYFADFHARQIAHYIAYSRGLTDPGLGRVYRLKAKDIPPANGPAFPRGPQAFTPENLLQTLLHHPSRWHRETALRLLGDRKTPRHNDTLRATLAKETGPAALHALWALNLGGGFGKETALQALNHRNPHVRRWSIRLLGDQRQVSPGVAEALAQTAASEPDPEVRAQLASTARRLPVQQALPILAHLLHRKEDATDPHIPQLLWWAFETHADAHAPLLQFFKDRRHWDSQLRTDSATPQQNLMRRWALAGSQAELQACAQLLRLSPDDANTQRLLKGFEAAFAGRPIPPLPSSLEQALSKARGQDSLLLAIRRNDRQAIGQGLDQVKNTNLPLPQRIQLARALGDIRSPRTTLTFTDLVKDGRHEPLRLEALLALQKLDDPRVAQQLVPVHNSLPPALQPATLNLLSSRASWAATLLQHLQDSSARKTHLDPETLDKLRHHAKTHPTVRRILNELHPHNPNPRPTGPTHQEHLALARAGGGNPKSGEALYHGKAACGACHTLFSRGGNLGPDLTPYDRNNLETLVHAITQPNAEIREGYENLLLTTTDGRILSGFKTEENPRLLILRGLDGQDHLVPRDQIRTLQPAGRSLMPPALLDPLTKTERRDLFAFLTSTTPPK